MNHELLQELDLLLNDFKAYPLSTSDIFEILDGKCNIVIYKDIHTYKSIDDLLGDHDCAVILYESKPYYGHWCCLFRQNDTLSFFDPLGGNIDDQLEFIDHNFAKESHQDFPYLTDLILGCPYDDLEYNQYHFQKDREDVSTCGRWCCLRLLLRDLSLEDFKDLLLSRSGDDVATILTSNVFDDQVVSKEALAL